MKLTDGFEHVTVITMINTDFEVVTVCKTL